MRHNFPILEQQNNINQTCNYLCGTQLAFTNRLQGELRNSNAREQDCAVIDAVFPTTHSCEALKRMRRGSMRARLSAGVQRLHRTLTCLLQQARTIQKKTHTSKGHYACGWRGGGWLADLNPLGHIYEFWFCKLHMQFCNNFCL